ncbi:MAG: imidazoleglycerol-phosphate dehydratase, partial [Deltaproteobacteria bacterium]|nr:imidazoleglycerol-phosphate dehydratase [Deltaproteobacteria bacterium]
MAGAVAADGAARQAVVERITSETQIRCTVNLDGVGKSQITCPIGFFGHMLDALTRHAHLDLELHI